MIDEWVTDPKQDRFDPLDGCKTMKDVFTARIGVLSNSNVVWKNSQNWIRLKFYSRFSSLGFTKRNHYIHWLVLIFSHYRSEAAVVIEKQQSKVKADGGWNESTPFQIIQGTCCCG